MEEEKKGPGSRTYKKRKEESAGQGGITRSKRTDSRTEKTRQKKWGQEAGQRYNVRKEGAGSSIEVEREAALRQKNQKRREKEPWDIEGTRKDTRSRTLSDTDTDKKTR